MKFICLSKKGINMTREFDILDVDAGTRIDKYLSEELPDISRSYIQKLIKEEQITVNGKIVKANYKVNAGDILRFDEPELKEPDILAENIPLDILYEDSDLLIINKPKGMVVHPYSGLPYLFLLFRRCNCFRLIYRDRN